VEPFKLFQSNLSPFHGEINHLALHHTGVSSSPGNQIRYLQPFQGVILTVATCGRQYLKSSCKQGVSGQYGSCFIKGLVTCWLASAKVIIVHGREIVMDQRISVNKLKSTRGRHRVGFVATHGFSRSNTQDRTQSFASRLKGVTHGLNQGGRVGLRIVPKRLKGSIDGLLLGFQVSL
jgi:hypothetical protein